LTSPCAQPKDGLLLAIGRIAEYRKGPARLEHRVVPGVQEKGRSVSSERRHGDGKQDLETDEGTHTPLSPPKARGGGPGDTPPFLPKPDLRRVVFSTPGTSQRFL
jgi:hypothetical protein